MFSFLHLQENLLYVQGDRPIASDLSYHIMSANSVFIRSTYSLNSHTLLVDLNVPTGELDFDLTLNIITACQQYQWKYKGDTYIVEASKAHDVLQDPRIIQDYSFYLVEGHMPAESPLQAYHCYLTFIICLPWKVSILILYNSWEIQSCVNGKLCLS